MVRRKAACIITRWGALALLGGCLAEERFHSCAAVVVPKHAGVLGPRGSRRRGSEVAAPEDFISFLRALLFTVVVNGDAARESQVEVREEREGHTADCAVPERRESLRVCSHFAVEANFMRDVSAEVLGYMFVKLGDKSLCFGHTHGAQLGHRDSGVYHALEDVSDPPELQCSLGINFACVLGSALVEHAFREALRVKLSQRAHGVLAAHPREEGVVVSTRTLGLEAESGEDEARRGGVGGQFQEALLGM